MLQEFKDFLANAPAGCVFVYHTGHLVTDRLRVFFSLDGTPNYAFNRPVHDVAVLALDAQNDNRVHLFQRKLGELRYDYIALKRSKYARNW